MRVIIPTLVGLAALVATSVQAAPTPSKATRTEKGTKPRHRTCGRASDMTTSSAPMQLFATPA